MSGKPLQLEDISQQIIDLATMIGEKFGEVDARFDGLETRMDNLESRMFEQEKAQRETNVQLINIEGRLEAVEADIKELYTLV